MKIIHFFRIADSDCDFKKVDFLTLEKFNFKKRKDCATIKSKYVTGDCEGIDFVIRTIFPIFERIAAWFGKVQMRDKGC